MTRAGAIDTPRITTAAARPATGGGHAAGPVRDDLARERALVVALRAGDPTALEEILLANEDRIYATCLRLIGDADQARDLAHDAVVKVIAGLPGFDNRSRLSTWITRIAMNVCLTELRRRKVRRAASLEAMSEEWVGRPRTTDWGRETGEPDIAERVEHEEELRRLGRAMLTLSGEQRAILMLRDLHELDYRQIAETLDVPVGTVKSRLFRARVALREAMENLDPRVDRDPAG